MKKKNHYQVFEKELKEYKDILSENVGSFPGIILSDSLKNISDDECKEILELVGKILSTTSEFDLYLERVKADWLDSMLKGQVKEVERIDLLVKRFTEELMIPTREGKLPLKKESLDDVFDLLTKINDSEHKHLEEKLYSFLHHVTETCMNFHAQLTEKKLLNGDHLVKQGKKLVKKGKRILQNVVSM
jgi:hypothetical protein